MWHYDEKGAYSVKSSSYVAMAAWSHEGPSSPDIVNKWWKFLWHLSIPSKAKIFIWRAYNNIFSLFEQIWLNGESWCMSGVGGVGKTRRRFGTAFCNAQNMLQCGKRVRFGRQSILIAGALSRTSLSPTSQHCPARILSIFIS